MNKQEFLSALRKGLVGLPQDDIEERVNFYSEMIDDRIEEGLSEEQAVSAMGSVDDIVKQILEQTPLTKIVKERAKPKRALRVWEIVLLLLGSPLWLSLLIAFVCIIISGYVVVWSVIISLWSVFAVLLGVALGGIVGSVMFTVAGYGAVALAVFGATLTLAGLSIFAFFGCKLVTKLILMLTRFILLCIKNAFIRKENTDE